MTTKTEQRILNLRQEIIDYFETHKYELKNTKPLFSWYKFTRI